MHQITDKARHGNKQQSPKGKAYPGNASVKIKTVPYDGFSEFGLNIVALFDNDITKTDACSKIHPIHPTDRFAELCRNYDIHVGIITAPHEAAQGICDSMVSCGITAVWNLAPYRPDSRA